MQVVSNFPIIAINGLLAVLLINSPHTLYAIQCGILNTSCSGQWCYIRGRGDMDIYCISGADTVGQGCGWDQTLQSTNCFCNGWAFCNSDMSKLPVLQGNTTCRDHKDNTTCSGRSCGYWERKKVGPSDLVHIKRDYYCDVTDAPLMGTLDPYLNIGLNKLNVCYQFYNDHSLFSYTQLTWCSCSSPLTVCNNGQPYEIMRSLPSVQCYSGVCSGPNATSNCSVYSKCWGHMCFLQQTYNYTATSRYPVFTKGCVNVSWPDAVEAKTTTITRWYSMEYYQESNYCTESLCNQNASIARESIRRSTTGTQFRRLIGLGLYAISLSLLPIMPGFSMLLLWLISLL